MPRRRYEPIAVEASDIRVTKHAKDAARRRCGISAAELADIVAGALRRGEGRHPTARNRRRAWERWVLVDGPAGPGTARVVGEDSHRAGSLYCVVTVYDDSKLAQGERAAEPLRSAPFAALADLDLERRTEDV